MALIKCPDCATEVSDRADKCPKCSYPLNSNQGIQTVKIDTLTVQLTSKKLKKKLLWALLAFFLSFPLLIVPPLGLTVMIGSTIYMIYITFKMWWEHG